MLKFIIPFLCLALLSCKSNKDAEGVLRSFVKKSVSNDLDKGDLEDYLAGSLLDNIKDVDQINEDEKSLRLIKMSVDYKKCEPTKCYITYTISYDDKKKKDVVVKVKKIAQVSSIEDEWKITSISNIKTFYEFKE